MKITYILEYLGPPEMDKPPFGKQDKIKKRFASLAELAYFVKTNLNYGQEFSIAKECISYIELDKEEKAYLDRNI